MTCDLGDLVRDASATVTLQVVSATVGNLTNTASVASTTDDPDSSNDTATITTLVSTETAADLAVSQTGTPDPVSVGAALTYLITVVNHGPAQATGVQLTAALPAQATWQATTPSQGSCTEPTDGRVQCALESLARGAQAAVTIVVTPTTAGTLSHTVSVAGNEDDPNGSNNTATLPTTVSVITAADLAVSQTATPNPVSVEGSLTYLMTVVNHGPAEATAVELTAVLPTGVTLDSARSSQGAGCTGTSTVHCGLGNLMPGSSATVTIVVTPTVAGTLTSTASVQGTEEDPNGENNTSTITTAASAGTDVDLAVSQFTLPDPVLEGQPLAYVITVVNNGPNVATGVLLTSTLPAGVTFYSATPLSACSAEPDTVRCALETLLLGTSKTVTLVVMPTAAGTLVHTVSVQGNEDDPLAGNNVSTATIEVTRDSDRDGLSDAQEAVLGTDPHNADTDGDGLRDGVETNTGVFIDVNDTGTDPLLADTDGDGSSDGKEVAACSNPVSAKSVPTTAGPLYPGQLFDTGSGQGIGRVVVADVNGDGVPDLITPIPAPADVSVALGCGDGTFGMPQFLDAGFDVGDDSGALPIAVAVADVNGDGKLDIITANAGFDTKGGVLFGKGIGSITILLENGDGTFQKAALTLAVGDAPVALAIADVNDDTQLDIITANAGSHDVTVLLGNGDGSFQSPLSFVVGTRPVAVGVDDVNDDGKRDIITAHSGSDDVAVLLGTAGSLFEPARFFPVGHGPAAVVVADADGNGTLDLVTANCGFAAATLQCTGADPGDVTVLLGTGNGTFPTLRSFTVGTHPIAVAVAKLNADNFPDLVIVNSDSDDMSILLGTGTADPLFQEHEQSPLAVGDSPVSVAVADVNNDAILDLIPATKFNGVGVFLGSADSTFQSRRLFSPGTDLDPHALVVADVNGDDLLDIITVNPDAFSVSVVLGKGSGDFETPQIFSVGNFPVVVAVADINHDGFLDIITANQSSDDVSVLFGQADFGFGSALSFAAGFAPAAVVVQDINCDNFPDLIVVNSDSADVSVLLGTGTTDLFQTQVSFAVDASPFAVVVADLDDDQKPDIVTANTDTNDVSVLLGNGDGTFQSPQRFFAGSGPRKVVVADVNNDGILDLITANSFSANVSVLLGNGDGTFQSPQHFFVGNGPRDVAVQDVDGDASPDLVTIPEGVIAVLLHR